MEQGDDSLMRNSLLHPSWGVHHALPKNAQIRVKYDAAASGTEIIHSIKSIFMHLSYDSSTPLQAHSLLSCRGVI